MAKLTSVVLYAEDEEFDRFLMERAFATSGLETALRTVSDGQAAIDYLSGKDHYGDRQAYPLPAVVLLDLNLPEVHGFEVLKWIRAQPAYSHLPVVVFSSSELPDDQMRARLLGANEFLMKPGSGLSFKEVVVKLNERWISGVDTQPKTA